MHTLTVGVVVLCASLVIPAVTLGQSRKEKKEARLAESAKPRSVSGGESFQIPTSAGNAFDTILKYFQRQAIELDDSSRKDLGKITTAIEVVKVGGFRNNERGYRTYVTLISENDNLTTVRVVKTEQKRTKHLQAEAWTDPVVMEKETKDIAEQIKTAFQAK